MPGGPPSVLGTIAVSTPAYYPISLFLEGEQGTVGSFGQRAWCMVNQGMTFSVVSETFESCGTVLKLEGPCLDSPIVRGVRDV